MRMIEIENIEKLELSYWLKRYLKSNRMTEDSFAAYSGLDVDTVRKAVSQKTIPQSAMKSIGASIHRSYEMFRVAPIEDPAVKTMMAMLALECRENSMCNKADSDTVSHAYRIIKENYAVEDIERASQWLRYLLQHPDSKEATFVIVQMEDIIKDCLNQKTASQSILDDTSTLNRVPKTLRKLRRTVGMIQKPTCGISSLSQRIRVAFQSELDAIPAPGYAEKESPEAIAKAKTHIAGKNKGK